MDNPQAQASPAEVPSAPHKFRVRFHDGPAAGIEMEYDKEMERVRYGMWTYEHAHKRVGDHWLFVRVPTSRGARRFLPLFTAARGGMDPRLEEKRRPEKIIKRGRNDVCWCGSGKKYKRCHASPQSN